MTPRRTAVLVSLTLALGAGLALVERAARLPVSAAAALGAVAAVAFAVAVAAERPFRPQRMIGALARAGGTAVLAVAGVHGAPLIVNAFASVEVADATTPAARAILGAALVGLGVMPYVLVRRRREKRVPGRAR